MGAAIKTGRPRLRLAAVASGLALVVLGLANLLFALATHRPVAPFLATSVPLLLVGGLLGGWGASRSAVGDRQPSPGGATSSLRTLLAFVAAGVLLALATVNLLFAQSLGEIGPSVPVSAVFFVAVVILVVWGRQPAVRPETSPAGFGLLRGPVRNGRDPVPGGNNVGAQGPYPRPEVDALLAKIAADGRVAYRASLRLGRRYFAGLFLLLTAGAVGVASWVLFFPSQASWEWPLVLSSLPILILLWWAWDRRFQRFRQILDAEGIPLSSEFDRFPLIPLSLALRSPGRILRDHDYRPGDSSVANALTAVEFGRRMTTLSRRCAAVAVATVLIVGTPLALLVSNVLAVVLSHGSGFGSGLAWAPTLGAGLAVLATIWVGFRLLRPIDEFDGGITRAEEWRRGLEREFWSGAPS